LKISSIRLRLRSIPRMREKVKCRGDLHKRGMERKGGEKPQKNREGDKGKREKIS